MVSLANGADVLNLINRVLRDPSAYRSALICSPFINGRGLALVEELNSLRGRNAPKVVVMSTPDVIRSVEARWAPRAGVSLHPITHLHAKVYAILGYHVADHQAVVTSANLTGSGLLKNLEVGVRLTGSDHKYVKLIERLPSRLRNSP